MTHFPLAQWADQRRGRWIFVLIAFFGICLYGASRPPHEAQESDAVVTPIKEPAVQVTQLEAMQEQVGPEGICTETPKAIQCKNKHGRKVITKAKE